MVVEPDYRLGVFGFFSYPELTKESGHNASGNFGLQDQVAALQWVVKNVAAFGGDPRNITIAGESAGSKHAGEIEYVFETLKSQEGMRWTEDDFKVSEAMASYWVNFIKTGNPNAKGLPEWPKSASTNGYQVMHLSGKGIHAAADSLRARYEFLDAQTIKPKPPTP
jgi:carboxylesterase type B